MKYQLFCTSYNQLNDGSLQLRNNWIEETDNNNLLDLIEKWNLSENFIYPAKNSISPILEGTMDTGNPIHVRIVRFN